MNNKLAIIFFLLCPAFLLAQQGNQTSAIFYDKYQFNPAYAGMEYSLIFNVVARSQWSGLEGSPKSQMLNAHFPLVNWNGTAGMSIYNESLGNISSTALKTSLGYVLDRSFGIFSFALEPKVQQWRIDGTKIITPDGIYQNGSVIHNDPKLSTNLDNGLNFNFGVGFYARLPQVEFGMTLHNLIQDGIKIQNLILAQKRHANLYFQYLYKVNDNFKINPSILLKSDFLDFQTDISIQLEYNGNVFGGIGLRGYNDTSIDATILTFGMNYSKNVKIVYSYDILHSKIALVSDGSHELFLSYNLNKLFGVTSTPKVIYNPRNL